MTDQLDEPMLKVLTPSATPEEVAAIVAVLAAVGGAADEPRKPVSEWAAHRRKLRTTYPHGPGGWRASALPR